MSENTKNINSDTTVHVYIVAGQSNAVGYNNIAEYRGDQDQFKSKYLTQDDVLFWNSMGYGIRRTGEWTRLGLSESGSFGPEISFAYDMARYHPGDRIAIVKCAADGTSIARSCDYDDYIPDFAGFNDNGNNWHWPEDGRRAGLLYRKLISNVRAAVGSLQDDGVRWELAGMAWMQGENEAGISMKMAADYENLLDEFIESVRHDLGMLFLPVAIGQVNSFDWTNGDIVRAAQQRYCYKDDNAILVETMDISREGSGGPSHFDANGTVELGKRFAEAMNKLVNG